MVRTQKGLSHDCQARSALTFHQYIRSARIRSNIHMSLSASKNQKTGYVHKSAQATVLVIYWAEGMQDLCLMKTFYVGQPDNIILFLSALIFPTTELEPNQFAACLQSHVRKVRRTNWWRMNISTSSDQYSDVQTSTFNVQRQWFNVNVQPSMNCTDLAAGVIVNFCGRILDLCPCWALEPRAGSSPQNATIV